MEKLIFTIAKKSNIVEQKLENSIVFSFRTPSVPYLAEKRTRNVIF